METVLILSNDGKEIKGVRNTSISHVTIPNSVTAIKWHAFKGCTALQSITIPNTVTSIGPSVFEGCTSLKNIDIPNSVTAIERFAFKGCTALQSINIPNSVTRFGGSAFEGCASLKSIDIPNSVTTIGKSAFEGTKWLENQPDVIIYINNSLYKFKSKETWSGLFKFLCCGEDNTECVSLSGGRLNSQLSWALSFNIPQWV